MGWERDKENSQNTERGAETEDGENGATVQCQRQGVEQRLRSVCESTLCSMYQECGGKCEV